MNKFIGIGNITKDIEIRKTSSDKSVIDFSIGINEKMGDREIATFINCQAWNGTAEIIAKYCSKGSKILVEGRIRTDSYEQDGTKKYKTYCVVEKVEFINTKKQETKSGVFDDTTMMGGTKSGLGSEIDIQPEELPFY